MIRDLLLTSCAPLKNYNEATYWENRPFSKVWPENNQQKKIDITRTKIKKQKRVRTAFSTHQLLSLERLYSRHRYIDSKFRAEIANDLKISDKCVKVWFQNRRMKEKRESSESSCDSSNESVSIASSPVPASPPLQVIIDEKKPEDLNQLTHNPEPTYHLPTYDNTNPAQSSYGSMAPPGFTTYFYNENTVYPTQYYPDDVNYSNSESNGYNQYGCCAANQCPYYSTL